MAAAKQFTSTTKESSVHEPSTAPPANAHPSRLATNPQPNPAAMGNATKSQSASETSNQPKASHDTSSNKRPTSKSSGNGTHADPVSNHSVPAVTKDRPLTEVISEKFAPFNHNHLVVGPFTEETSRDANFEQELGALLLDAMLETHAWAAARPKFESQLAVQKLENKISDVIDVEGTQERTRQNLSEFVIKMKSALAALTGF